MAPPYRRSCLTCVKAKRRCEFSSGPCKRCTNKNLSCSLNRMDHHENAPPSDYATDDDIREAQWLATLTRGQNLDLDIQWPEFDQNIVPGEPPTDQTIDVDNIFTTTAEPPKNDTQSPSCIFYERVTYVSRQFRTYPAMFVKRGQNPFIHRFLYEQNTPLAISDAMSCCALYEGKNECNELLVFNDLSSKARNLVARNGFSMTTSDLLASTQALLLYQILRLFDGDIRLRAEAENAEPVMMAWAERLLGFSKQLPAIPEDGSSLDMEITTSWREWVCAESCRRTVLTCYMLQGIYSFLKFGYDNVAAQIYKLSFTAQARIWNAPSQYVWDEAIKKYKHFQVTIKQWDAAMEGAENDDLEELGIIILASMKGVNVCSWVGKANLGRWGLAKKCITGD
ncbi:hypothetical protein BJ875DRAFT_377291 [Amylocarpus encephaloides]|uniref:Zn(2)-C6 fungal-type domain-containing protein n=1 Tax=Amylocarpus encephaloides TaxID=45428 RepID=A0A9P7YIY6_9HELO|nr:hypothetical protein BJ875DRAFT_377291 [Amylocarpus encephaloides]